MRSPKFPPSLKQWQAMRAKSSPGNTADVITPPPIACAALRDRSFAWSPGRTGLSGVTRAGSAPSLWVPPAQRVLAGLCSDPSTMGSDAGRRGSGHADLPLRQFLQLHQLAPDKTSTAPAAVESTLLNPRLSGAGSPCWCVGLQPGWRRVTAVGAMFRQNLGVAIAIVASGG